jgi:histidinol-phosphate aminotransferase
MQYRSIINALHEYVPGKSIDEVKAKYGLDSVYKIASNENPLGPSPKAVQAMQKALVQVHRYPLGNAPELSALLAQKLEVDCKNLCFGNGSDELVWLLTTILVNAGDSVISSEPTFSEYGFCTQLMQGQYIPVPMQDYCHQLPQILNAIQSNTKIIFICNPNNPTGTIIPKQELLDFIEAVPPNILVVVDQAYIEYAQDSVDSISLIEQALSRPNLLLLRTFSKLYGLAGLRIGYAISHAELIAALYKVKQPFNVNILAQLAACAAIEDTEHCRASLELNTKGMQELQVQMDELQYPWLPSAANYLAVHVGPTALSLVQYLEQSGVIIRSLKSFGMPEWVRITIGLPAEMQALMQAWRQFLSINNGGES